jgi:hypothetical protein
LADSGLELLPARFVAGTPVTLTARISAGSALVPRGQVSFDLGPDGSGQCSNVQVVDRTATCQATFKNASTQPVTVSYTGDIQRSAGSATGIVAPAPLVNAPYYPASGGDWEAGGTPTAYPFQGLPAGAPKQIAVSHDGTAMAAIGSNGLLYVRVDDPLKTPPPDFALVYGPDGLPMPAARVALDTDPNTKQLQMVAIWKNGQVYHRAAPYKGSWTPWGALSPGFLATDLAMSIDGQGNGHFVAIGVDHNVNYQRRYPDGSWNSWWQLIPNGAGGALQASRVALSAATAGTSNGTIDLDLIGYGKPGSDSWVWRFSRPLGGSWGYPSLVAYSLSEPFNELAVGQLQRTTSAGPANVELVAATIGTDLLRYLRVDGTWQMAGHARTSAGSSNLAVNLTPDTTGIGITTSQ